MTKSMENVCRTCMVYNARHSVTESNLNDTTELNETKLLSIFIVPDGMKDENLSLEELLKATMPQLKFKEHDKMPKNVCIDCAEKIIGFYNFQLMCLRNEDKFYRLLEVDDAIEPFSNKVEGLVFKTEIMANCLNQNSLEELSYDEKTIENNSDIDSESNKSDVLSLDKTKDSKCKLTTIKQKKLQKKSVKSLKKKLKQTSSGRRTKSTQRNSKEFYSCDKCQRKLKSEISLMKHQQLHLKKYNEEKELKCNICNEAFSEIATFKDHQRTHTSEKTFLCSECGKGFTSAGSLKQHSFRHLDKKLYPCPDCPKSFPTNGDLLCHYETHKAKPRIHVCDVCGRGFYKPFLLKQHKRYHNDERPFACEFCEKRFVTSEKQRRHLRTHTGEKPYPCKYCDRAFAQSNDCIKHLRQHLGDNVYQCELCPLRFPLARSLRVHFAGHKDDDDETRSRNLQARMEEEQNLQMKLSTQDL